MADIVELMAFAQQRMKNSDSQYGEKVDVALALMRSLGVLSHYRASVNCMAHRLFAGALVSAYDNKTYVELYSRRMGDLHKRGYSTRIIPWLDKCVEEGLLIPANPRFIYAKGKMQLGHMLKHYLAYASTTFHYPVERNPKQVAAHGYM